MSKILNLAAQVVENQDTNTYRIMIQFYKDDTLDVSCVLHRVEAEKLAHNLLKLCGEVRKKQPGDAGSFISRLSRSFFRRKPTVKKVADI